MLFTKLDLPPLKLPENWHTNDVERIGMQVTGYQSFYLTGKVEKQVRKLFPKFFFKSNCDLIGATFRSGCNGFIHKDSRSFAINYLITSGGDNAHTDFYDEDRNIIDSYTQKPGEWYFLNTYNLHSISGITGLRTQVSISFFNTKLSDEHWNFLHEKAIK